MDLFLDWGVKSNALKSQWIHNCAVREVVTLLLEQFNCSFCVNWIYIIVRPIWLRVEDLNDNLLRGWGGIESALLTTLDPPKVLVVIQFLHQFLGRSDMLMRQKRLSGKHRWPPSMNNSPEPIITAIRNSIIIVIGVNDFVMNLGKPPPEELIVAAIA